MLDRSEAQVRERLLAVPDGTTRARTYFDHDGHKSTLARVEVELRKDGDRLVFDYGRTAEQLPGFFNCTMSGLRGGVFSAILPVLAHDIPWNSGVMRAIEVTAPEGTIVNARHPAPCGASTTGATTIVQSTAGSALSTLVSTHDELRGEARAVTTGGLMVFHIAGRNQYGEPYGGAMTEVLAGGAGANVNRNGVDYRGPNEILTGQFNNVEGEEAVFPLLYLNRSANTDGGGAGRHHGGVSVSSSFVLHDTDALHGVMAGHSMSMPNSLGLHGGLPGSTHQVTIVRGGEPVVYTGSPGEIHLAAGDVVDWSFHGGGGWGDPLDADPDEVLADVTAGRISTESASRLYGVVLTAGAVDREETTARRNRERARRRLWARDRVFGARQLDMVGDARRIGDRLVLTHDGVSAVYACDCGNVIAPADENWKDYAAHSRLSEHDLGPKVRLHPGLRADAYACAACGTLLAVEIRAHEDEPLRDVELAGQSG